MPIPNDSIPDALAFQTPLQGGAYVVGPVLGQGGFGITYWCGDQHLQRYVAIKELFPAGSCLRVNNTLRLSGGMTAADFATIKAQFVNEARALVKFNHPGIVRVHTYFEEHNTAYMVMEYLKGKTLLALVEERRVLPEAEAVTYIKNVAEALAVVHNANMLHRDINPSNIIVCEDGRVVLIDFGLTKEMEQVTVLGTRKLAATTRLGTEGYAAPEQYVKHAPVGAPTDIYALGATLYHLLTGAMPASATDRMYGVAMPTVRQASGAVSQALSEAVQWAMEVKETSRPPSVRDFLQRLGAGNHVAPTKPQPIVSTPPQPAPLTFAPPATPVRQYDFTVNTTAGLEKAIAQAKSGATILLKPGEYRLNSTIEIKKSLNLIGDTAGSANCLILSSILEKLVYLTGTCVWKIENIAFKCSSTTQRRLLCIDGGNLELRSCSFEGNGSDERIGVGLHIAGKTRSNIAKCSFTRHMVGVLITDNAQVTLKDNLCSDNNYGITFGDKSIGIARNNKCQENKFSGIWAFCAQVTLEGNLCSNNNSGIDFSGEVIGTMRNNKCQINKLVGVVVRGRAKVTLEDNLCFFNDHCGIVFMEEATGVVRNNKCQSNKDSGIEVIDRAQVILEGNLCSESDGGGIDFNSQATGTVCNNRCQNNKVWGISAYDHAQVALEGNFCANNDLGGIGFIDETTGTAYNNECLENRIGLFIANTAKPILIDNRCHRNRDADTLDKR